MQTMTLLNQTKIPVLGFVLIRSQGSDTCKRICNRGNLSWIPARGYSGFL